MPPKKASKTAGLLAFFAKQQEQRKANEKAQNDTFSESCQVIFQKAPVELPKTPTMIPTKWDNQVKENSLIFGEKTGRDWQNPCVIPVMKKSSEKVTKKNLLDNGYDDIQGNGLFYPVNEKVRKFEANLVRCCALSNCCIAIPSSAPSTSAKIVAITSFNFLKWFPRSRVLLVCSTVNMADQWIEEMKHIGIDANELTKVATVSAFKSLKGDVGRVLICCSPQCAAKTVESAEAREIIEDIRLCMIDLKPNECCNKLKPMVTALTVRDVFFRTVVITTSVLNTSRRTAVITKRQQTITNLQLSDWIEQSETDHAFRISNIPPGIEIKYWNNTDFDEKHLEILNLYVKATTETLARLAKDAIIPSKRISKLVWICWESMKIQASQNPRNGREILQQVCLAELICIFFKVLVIDGVVAGWDFLEKRNADSNELMGIVKNIDGGSLGNIFQKLKDLATGKENLYHGKYKYLFESVDTFKRMDKNVRGIIITRDQQAALEVQNFLRFKYQNGVHIVRIVENEHAGATDSWPIGRISTVLHDQKTPKVVIVPLKIRDFVTSMDNFQLYEVSFIICMDRDSIFNLKRYDGPYLAILHDAYERMRKDDGRVIVDDMKFTTRDQQKNVKVGAVERYEFKFEPSRLRLNSAKMPFVFYWPTPEALKGGAGGQSFVQIGKTQMELSSKEHTELMQRMKNVDFSKYRGKKRSFMVLDDKAKEVNVMHDDAVFWNDELQYLGDVKSSNLSRRLTEYISNRPLARSSRHKKKFQYVNEVTDTKRVQMLDLLIRKLDAVFV